MKKKIPYIIFLVFILGLTVRCFYSFCWSDESFYLSLIHRFWVGDKPLVEEWSGVQFYAILLLPLYSLYILIKGNNDGIYLAARLFYIFCNSCLSFYIFKSIKKEAGSWIALGSSLIYMLYLRANIQGISYYSIGLFSFSLAVYLLYNSKNNKKNYVRLISVGILLFIAAVAVPFIVIAYIIVGGGVLTIKRLRCKKNVLFVILGGFVIGSIIYVLYFLSFVKVDEAVFYFPNIFGDPEHVSGNLLISAILAGGRIVYRYIYTFPFWGYLIAYLLYIRYIRHDKINEKQRRRLFLINVGVWLINVLLSYDILGCVIIASSIFMVICLLLDYNLIDISKGLLLKVFLPGIAFSLIFHASSNTGLDSLTIGFALSGTCIPVVLNDFFKSNEKLLGKWGKIVLISVVSITVIQSAFLRIFSVYRDDNLSELTERIEYGPAKNLFTTKQHKEEYNDIVEVINNTCKLVQGEQMAITEIVPWAYLCMNNSYGLPSPCRFWGGINKERLMKYYEKMPYKFPEYILDIDSGYGGCRSIIIQGNEIIENPNGTGEDIWLVEEAIKRGYNSINSKCGIVYIKDNP